MAKRMRKSACAEAVESELRAAGVTFMIVYGGKHPKFKFKLRDRNITYPVPFSSRDTMRAHKHARAAIRRMLRQHLSTPTKEEVS